MNALQRHAVSVEGPEGAPSLVFGHGFGCDQSMWEPVAAQFPDYRTVLFDLVGFGQSDLAAFEPAKYSSLDGHAADLLDVCAELSLTNPVFIGHSVSAMIGVLASNKRPGYFSGLVLVGPSPRYINDDDYHGGFTRSDIESMLELLEADFYSWSENMAPLIAGNPDRPEFGAQLTESFCRSDYEAARLFAHATFLADNREDLADVDTPTLVMQCSEDPIAPNQVGEYVHAAIPGSRLKYLRARGHTPNLTAPNETARAIREFLDEMGGS